MRFPALLTALLLLHGPADGMAQAPDRFAPVRASIQRFLDSTGTASVAVAVAQNGRILWEEGFGWANRERMIRADEHTMYSLASISKPITATALMVLVERGKVDLDRPANDYLGLGRLTGLAGPAEAATVRRVLSHTAGLPLHYQFFYADKGYRPPTMDETISRYGNLVYAPGSRYEYSNLGFGIADHIVERVSGMSFADFVRTEVFLPLGMTRTAVDIPPSLADYAAERYDARQHPIPFYTFDHAGASAVYSSAHDLVRFGMFHLKQLAAGQRKILTDRTLDEMHRPVAPAAYGLGFSATDNDMGLTRYGHTGGMPGVATTMVLYPDEGISVVVLANGNARPDFLAQDIVATMVPRFAENLRAARARPNTPPPAAPVTALAGEWQGTLRSWQRTVPMRLLVQPDGDVHVWIGEQPRAILNQARLAGGRFTGRVAGAMPTDDAGRWPHDLLFGLVADGNTLRGQVNAMSLTDPIMYSLSGFASLERSR